MELRHLRYFVAVAEERHFGRAAERLHMAQPPLSSQIKQLETLLGTQLLERTTRKVELTDAGRLLLDRARQVLADVDAIRMDVPEVGRGAAGVLRVGFAGTATYRLMPEMISQATTHLPKVRLQVLGEMLTPHMEQALLENRLDVAVLRPPVRSTELTLDEFEQSPMMAALPLGHPLAAAPTDPLDLADLATEEFVGYPPDSAVSSIITEACRQAGFRPRLVQEASETSTLMALVGAGLGVAIVPQSQALPTLSKVVMRPLTTPITVGLATAWKTENGSPLIQAFRALARTATSHLHHNAGEPSPVVTPEEPPAPHPETTTG